MADTKTVNDVDGAELLSIVERIERLKTEAKSLAEDIKELFAEAKSRRYDVSTLKKVLKAREQDRAEREHSETLFDVYMSAIGEK